MRTALDSYTSPDPKVHPSWHAMADLADLEANWPLAHVIDWANVKRVVVIGAYKGKLMHYIALRTKDYEFITGYEPQVWAAQAANERFSRYELDNVGVLDYGLATTDVTHMALTEFGTDACSLVAPSHRDGHDGVGQFHEAASALGSLGKIDGHGNGIDLMVMNIEGYEWTLLPHLLAHSVVPARLAVQFHEGFAQPSVVGATLAALDQVYTRNHPYHLLSWGYWWAPIARPH